MSNKFDKGMPSGLIEKTTPNIYKSPLLKKAVVLAEMDGIRVDESSQEGKLQPLLGDELHGGNPNYNADLSLYGKIFNNPDEEDRRRRVAKYKQELLYPTVLTDPKIAATIRLKEQYKIACVRGQGGDIDNPEDTAPEIRIQASDIVIKDQKASLDIWVDYLTSPDADYPTWFKHYVLTSVTKMGVYDKEKQAFSGRSTDTITKFPDLNREAVSKSYDAVYKYYVKGEKHSNEELQAILDTANFSKIYAFAIEKLTPASKENKEKTEGEWTKFNQGDDATALYESLQGHNTGWCTAGEEYAKTQLSNGDFYVYYSKDEQGKNTIPRIAIRMENDQVAEVRGIELEQNMEANMLDIAREKYQSLSGGDKFEKKDHNMKLLTLIDEKTKKNELLTKEELIFLYQWEQLIEGFGYTKDPRIEDVLSRRKKVIKSDLSLMTGFSENEISITLKEALSGKCKYHYGSFYGFPTNEIVLSLPKTVKGDIGFYDFDFNNVLSFTMPELVDGSISYDMEYISNNLPAPKIVTGDIIFHNLVSVLGLNLPDTVGGYVSFPRLGDESKEKLRQNYPNLWIK